MKRDDYLDAIRREGVALITAAGRDLDAHVPSCPAWKAVDLVRHVAGVHGWAAGIIQADGGPPSARPSMPEGDPVELYERSLARLLDALDAREMDRPAWTWSGETTVAFWFQRMAQETAVHRWDAENTAGEPLAIEPTLSADGVDEVSDRFLRIGPPGGDGETIHLHATDTPGEWLWRLLPGSTEVSRGHEKGDVAARGTASDLLLVLWRRLPLERLEVFGNRDVLAGALERFRFGR